MVTVGLISPRKRSGNLPAPFHEGLLAITTRRARPRSAKVEKAPAREPFFLTFIMQVILQISVELIWRGDARFSAEFLNAEC
mgnify:CR=1 FL=1